MSAHRYRAHLVAALASAGVCACSLAVSTGGLSGGADVAPALEGGSDGGSESASDARVDSDAQSVPFCASRTAAFCADFDDADLAKGWTGKLESGALLGVVSDGVSPPFALRVSAPAPPMNDANAARLWWDTALPAGVHVELDVRLQVPTPGYYEVLKLETPSTHETDSPTALSGAIELGTLGGGLFSANSEGWDASGTRYATAYDGTVATPNGRWIHVVLDVAFGLTGSIHVTLDGQTAIDAKGVRTLTDGAKSLRLVVGPYVDGTAATVDTSYDNVVVDVTP